MTDQDRLLDAALTHAVFDGWSDRTLAAARAECGMTEAEAKAIFPRGAVDMALAYHRRGDLRMVTLLEAEDLSSMRFRDRIGHAVRLRLDLADKDLVRRGLSLFALPQYAADGSKALWNTADLIWTALGDTSRDINWYTKRASLSAVYSSTVLYWLGDTSDGNAATWAFLDRRIDNVMQFEKAKAKLRDTKLAEAFRQGPGRILETIRAPGEGREDYPGRWRPEDKA